MIQLLNVIKMVSKMLDKISILNLEGKTIDKEEKAD